MREIASFQAVVAAARQIDHQKSKMDAEPAVGGAI